MPFEVMCKVTQVAPSEDGDRLLPALAFARCSAELLKDMESQMNGPSRSFVCFCQSHFKFIAVLYDNWHLTYVVECLGDIKPQSFSEVIQK